MKIRAPCRHHQTGVTVATRILQELTTRTIRRGKAGRRVKRFARKDELYAALGL